MPASDLGARAFEDPRPEPVSAVGEGICYLDVSRASAEDLERALPQLRAAAGVVVDLRSYPQPGTERLLRLLTNTPIPSAQWRRPVTAWADRRDVVFDRSAWLLFPEHPGIEARIAFITGAGAISYAETCLGIVEALDLATIVGAPTAGANGNNNVFMIHGGYRVGWTGMRVLKHDGSVHHNVGVLPDIPTKPSRAGIREGRDELLERALRAVADTEQA